MNTNYELSENIVFKISTCRSRLNNEAAIVGPLMEIIALLEKLF